MAPSDGDISRSRSIVQSEFNLTSQLVTGYCLSASCATLKSPCTKFDLVLIYSLVQSLLDRQYVSESGKF